MNGRNIKYLVMCIIELNETMHVTCLITVDTKKIHGAPAAAAAVLL
jgi:hypothetical protein